MDREINRAIRDGDAATTATLSRRMGIKPIQLIIDKLRAMHHVPGAIKDQDQDGWRIHGPKHGLRKMEYFCCGHLVHGALTQYIRRMFPESEAVMLLFRYSADNAMNYRNVRIGAWQTISRDAILSTYFKRRVA